MGSQGQTVSVRSGTSWDGRASLGDIAKGRPSVQVHGCSPATRSRHQATTTATRHARTRARLNFEPSRARPLLRRSIRCALWLIAGVLPTPEVGRPAFRSRRASGVASSAVALAISDGRSRLIADGGRWPVECQHRTEADVGELPPLSPTRCEAPREKGAARMASHIDCSTHERGLRFRYDAAARARDRAKQDHGPRPTPSAGDRIR